MKDNLTQQIILDSTGNAGMTLPEFINRMVNIKISLLAYLQARQEFSIDDLITTLQALFYDYYNRPVFFIDNIESNAPLELPFLDFVYKFVNLTQLGIPVEDIAASIYDLANIFYVRIEEIKGHLTEEDFQNNSQIVKLIMLHFSKEILG